MTRCMARTVVDECQSHDEMLPHRGERVVLENEMMLSGYDAVEMRPRQPASSRKLRLPRVPLPRQTGGAHEDKTKRPFRRRKHKKRDSGD
ncbi:MAG: hypothetical protein C5B57_14050 [Blastocatellia bacterium]|nr:MAG: hypothetical protein C5B57_14050 [Blastocatellia bacterium]